MLQSVVGCFGVSGVMVGVTLVGRSAEGKRDFFGGVCGGSVGGLYPGLTWLECRTEAGACSQIVRELHF